MPIDEKLKEWENNLLDLSNRNSLMNFHQTESNYLELNDFKVIYEKILNGKDYSLTNNINKVRQGEELPKILKKLQNKARRANEEQGVHTLYLSFGFLKWKDEYYNNRDQYSPLILVPIVISLDKRDSKIKKLGDEVVINPTLTHYLKDKYQIDFSQILPVPENIDQFKVEEIRGYIDSCIAVIESKIEEMENWSVEKRTIISLLPFSRIEMYNDLKKREEKIKNHGVIRLLAGENDGAVGQGWIGDYQEFCDGTYKHDDNDPQNVYQIVDADSSQQDAIELSKIGVSFVLQGPPGTGKSQTITNIIAEALAHGKKVLFVAEKKVALNVVYERLKSNRLDDFCLFLDSDQENKKTLMNLLWDNFNADRIEVNESVDKDLKRLKKIRNQLNDYNEQLHRKIEPLDQSIFEANAKIAELKSVPDIDIGDIQEIIGEFDDFSKDKCEDFEKCLNNYKTAIYNLKVENNDYTKHSWFCCKLLDNIGLLERRTLKNNLNDFHKRIDNFIGTIRELGGYCETINLGETKIADISKNVEMLHSCEVSNKYQYPVEWLEKSGEEFDKLKKIADSREKEKNRFNAHFGEVIFSLSTEEISSWLSCFNSRMCEVLKPDRAWFNDDWSEKRQGWINWTKERIEKIISYKKEILERYEDDIFSIECEQLLDRFQHNYTSWWKLWFNNKYKDDRNSILRLSRDHSKTVSHADMIILLEKLAECRALLNELDEHDSNLRAVLGGWYEGVGTLFEEMQRAISIFDSICDIYHEDDLHHIENQLPAGIEPFLNVANEDLIKNYRVLKEYKGFLEEEEKSGECNRQKYDFLYKGIQTDWAYVLKCLKWSKQFKNYVSEFGLTESFQQGIATGEYSQKSGRLATELKTFNDESQSYIKYFKDNIFNEEVNIESYTITDLEELIKCCHENIDKLDDWIAFKKSKQEIDSKNLNDFLEKAKQRNINPSDLWNVFQKSMEYAWFDWAVEKNELHEIDNANGHPIEDFKKLDKKQWKSAIARIRKAVISNIPNNGAWNVGDEIEKLRGEYYGRSRKTIRRFLNEIPTLLLKLKPCLLMSPLAVSRYLGDDIEFDMVIFDEASQIRTEEAIGAISRASQVIIAGDRHQLPPTPYFRRHIDDDINENDNVTFTSVLDEARNLPQIMLKWHYRSRNENLIAFSNYKFYDSELITFPTPCNDSNQDDGVEYIYVENAVYKRGERDNNNPMEAQKVVDIVFEQIDKNPRRSLGVIAFNSKQAACIEDKIEEYRRNHQSNEYDEFFNEDKENAFFVKSLEEVQGDERDTIICSVGYGKDQAGDLYMNFGPLNHKEYGYRRLNVAITRAKYALKLVSSITEDEIRIDDNADERSGLKLLKDYIRFAKKGISSLSEYNERNNLNRINNEKIESPFERSVSDFLRQTGYTVDNQVGCSGYRIDMAVRHPETRSYVLAIECDGATYHSSRTARDRDRLRQEILEKKGWKFYRIWSTDWIRSSEREQKRLVEAIERAIQGDSPV